MVAPVRVRFAPSPTGEPHVGSLRTALFNYLFARQHRGTFIVRIEDTDRSRLVPGSDQRMFDALAWIGITMDEGPPVGGPHRPYVQSERLVLYREHAATLVAAGHAYECYCTTERLARLRAQGSVATMYDRTCRDLTEEERSQRRASGAPTVIRLKVPESGTFAHRDLIRGEVSFAASTVDDTVLMKSDGFPTYHLAHVVDDHLMEISHVIRGEEWLPSLPKHLCLYQAFGWAPPQFAHLPLLLGKDRSKLSKRHGSFSVQRFQDEGYVPPAVANFLALLGWNPGDERELFTLDELIHAFSLERVQPSGAVFDETKLAWMNLQHLRRFSDDEYGAQVQMYLKRIPSGVGERPPPWFALLARAVRERVKRFADIPALIGFVEALPPYEPRLLVPKKHTAAQARDGLAVARQALQVLPEAHWNVDAIRQGLDQAGQQVGDRTSVLWTTRVAITGQAVSPPVYESTALLDRAEALQRLSVAEERLNALR
ncbi:MAG: glutamate--tRNA ligase [Candidatus Kerfeldbacteria bacterium]|nr:glutamate--tRNA ligase [Candidatus Kerfeldbacteria bacterium]